ncbi:MAG: TRAP-type C4-dicarboxylate transport system substrate-binding protein, partial [Alphaproteobacteria bacterium]
MLFLNQREFRRYGIAAAILGVAAVGAAAPAVAAEVKPVNIRFASDLTGPPHPAAIAKEYFREVVEKKIPGSKVRTYFAGALYNIPQAVEAMTEGNLEMAWGQFGKSAQIDPFMNVVVGPMLMSTPGAINALDDFDTIKMLKARMAKV